MNEIDLIPNEENDAEEIKPGKETLLFPGRLFAEQKSNEDDEHDLDAKHDEPGGVERVDNHRE